MSTLNISGRRLRALVEEIRIVALLFDLCSEFRLQVEDHQFYLKL